MSLYQLHDSNMCIYNHDYTAVYVPYNELKIIKLVLPARKLACYASIMLMLFHAYYAQNYAGIIRTCLHIKLVPIFIILLFNYLMNGL